MADSQEWGHETLSSSRCLAQPLKQESSSCGSRTFSTTHLSMFTGTSSQTILDHAHPGRSTFALLIFVSQPEHHPSGNSYCVVSTQWLGESVASAAQRLKQRSHFLFMKCENEQENWLQDKREGRGEMEKEGSQSHRVQPRGPQTSKSLSPPSLYTLFPTPFSFPLPPLPVS